MPVKKPCENALSKKKSYIILDKFLERERQNGKLISITNL